MVGAFVVEVKNGEQTAIASNASMMMGAFGNAPTDWKFVKLGASDYWGWQSESGDCHHGECYSNHILLAPYGKDIRDLTAGAIGSSRSDRDGKSIDTKIEAIDSSKNNVRVYPLLLSVSAETKDRKLPPKNIAVPFDPKAWKYIMPKDWVPTDQESGGS